MADLEHTLNNALAAEAARLRESGALGRSNQLIRLFDFILACSLEGRSPKEIEVAREVFDRGGEPGGDDASVRVYVHRLRKKLAEYYADRDGLRLDLPRGEYRLQYGQAAPALDCQPDVDPPASDDLGSRRSWITIRFWTLGLVLVTLNLAAWVLFLQPWHRVGAPAAADAPFWRELANGKPTVVVAGDYYLFGETNGAAGVARLIREPSIDSSQALDQYLLGHPTSMGKYVDLEMGDIPVGVLSAVRDVLPLVETGSGTAWGKAPLFAASHLTPDMLKTQNIVYVGLFSGLGLLSDPLARVSGFAITPNDGGLVDRVTGRRFGVDWQQAFDQRRPQQDYAYLASFPGPTGNHIRILGGTRDAALMQAAELSADKDQLDEIARRVHAEAFEALFEVRTLHNLNLGSALVAARPLRDHGIWSPYVERSPGMSSFGQSGTGR